MKKALSWGLGITLIAVVGLILLPSALGRAEASQDRIQKPPQDSLPIVRPQIQDVKLKTYQGSMIGLEIIGTGFGSASPTKCLFIDGIKADPAEVYPWTAGKIDVDEEVFNEIGGSFIWADHTYRFEIKEGAKTISNVFSKSFPLELNRVTPTSGPAGTVIEVVGAGFSHPGDLMLDKTACEILARTPGTIRAKVPTIAVGRHELSIVQSGKRISETKSFNVVMGLSR